MKIPLSSLTTPGRLLVGLTAIVSLAGLSGGSAVAGTASSSAPGAHSVTDSSNDHDPCGQNAPHCQGIGVTDSWFKGGTVNLNYSHPYFCGNHRLSRASTGCEIGAPTKVRPPSGKVVSPIYVITPIGFTPKNLQCPVVGNCIDHPARIDASRVFGESAKNALAPAHSHIIVDRENALSSWWPVVVIGVTNARAWNYIAQGQNLTTVQRIRRAHPKWVTPNIPSNLYLFFQVVPGGDKDGAA